MNYPGKSVFIVQTNLAFSYTEKIQEKKKKKGGGVELANRKSLNRFSTHARTHTQKIKKKSEF